MNIDALGLDEIHENEMKGTMNQQWSQQLVQDMYKTFT